MIELILYTRRDCELCHEMEEVLGAELQRFDARLERVEIDERPELETLYGQEVPVLFINRRKAFKFRCTAREFRKRMLREIRREVGRDVQE
ncbi:MAG: glutaredoxin family protein [Candidatus Binataceae bacterium]